MHKVWWVQLHRRYRLLYFVECKSDTYCIMAKMSGAYYIRAGGNGLAAPVFVGPVFLMVKMKFHFYK